MSDGPIEEEDDDNRTKYKLIFFITYMFFAGFEIYCIKNIDSFGIKLLIGFLAFLPLCISIMSFIIDAYILMGVHIVITLLLFYFNDHIRKLIILLIIVYCVFPIYHNFTDIMTSIGTLMTSIWTFIIAHKLIFSLTLCFIVLIVVVTYLLIYSKDTFTNMYQIIVSIWGWLKNIIMKSSAPATSTSAPTAPATSTSAPAAPATSSRLSSVKLSFQNYLKEFKISENYEVIRIICNFIVLFILYYYIFKII